jgi:GTP-binding protein Era
LNQTQTCGYVAIVGRPNVGKSTLLNNILGQKISITTPKPQTTRQQILGIKTVDDTQAVYIDLPGLHRSGKRALNRYMNRVASGAIKDVDIVLFMVDALQWRSDDAWILEKLTHVTCPVLLLVNKVDQVKDKNLLLPFIEDLSKKFTFAEIVPLSAIQGAQVEKLEQTLQKYLPAGQFMFPVDQITDKSERFLIAEIIREKLMATLEEEVPYSLTVEIEQLTTTRKVLHIDALIWVEKPGQKPIVIGAGGERLKYIGKAARLELQNMFRKKIYLKLFVKVKSNWADDEKFLDKFFN